MPPKKKKATPAAKKAAPVTPKGKKSAATSRANAKAPAAKKPTPTAAVAADSRLGNSSGSQQPPTESAGPDGDKKKKLPSEHLKALVASPLSTSGSTDAEQQQQVNAEPSTSTNATANLTDLLCSMLRSLYTVARVMRIQTGTNHLSSMPNSSRAAITLDTKFMDAATRTCGNAVTTTRVMQLAQVFPDFLRVAWDSSTSAPRITLLTTSVPEMPALLESLKQRGINSEAALRRATEGSPTPGVEDGNNGAHAMSPMKQRNNTSQLPPASPAPRMRTRFLGEETDIEAIPAGKESQGRRLASTIRSESMQLPDDLVAALPEAKLADVVAALKHKQHAEETNLDARLAYRVRLEKTMALYDLVRSTFGLQRSALGGTMLLETLRAQGSGTDGEAAVLGRFHTLLSFREAGISMKGVTDGVPMTACEGPALLKTLQECVVVLDRTRSNRKALMAAISRKLEEDEQD